MTTVIDRIEYLENQNKELRGCLARHEQRIKHLDKVHEILLNRVNDLEGGRKSHNEVLDIFCDEHQIPRGVVTGKNQSRTSVNYRYLLAVELRKYKATDQEIADLLKRDRTTIYNLFQRGLK